MSRTWFSWITIILVAATLTGFGKGEDADMPTQGCLQVLRRGGENVKEQIDLPLKHTDVKAEISGYVTRVKVRQTFSNPYDTPIEAVYVFPLPDESAVNDMTITIGDRVIKGEIKKRDEARKIYEDAKNAGKTAALLEQERPNIFTQSVANIGPGETIRVVIRYVQALPYEDGAYELVFPMVVGPRYIPGSPASTAPRGRGRMQDTDQVPDASRITPYVTKPGERPGHDIQVRVDIDAGVPLRGLQSRQHQVTIKRDGESRATVELDAADRIPNKDFVLNIGVAGEQPEVGLLSHHDGKHGYFALVLQPPKEPTAAQVRPREVVLVLDCSGSMNGKPIQLSKRAAEKVLDTLGPQDTFNILSFNRQAEAYSPQPVAATEHNVRAGARHIRGLRASGGTEMMTGVRAALEVQPSEEVQRIVVFFTDGYIGNETAIIGAIQQMLGPARLHAFGVGGSVNRYLLDRMAIAGRGTVQYVLLNDKPEAVAERFAERLAKPVLTDVTVKFQGATVRDLVPDYIPDVLDGKPVLAFGRYDRGGKATVEVVGRIGAKASAATMDIELASPSEDRSPLPSIWARQQIKQLEMDRSTRGANVSAIDERILAMALEYSLLTRLTAFVCVDETPAQLAGGPAKFVPVRTAMAKDVSYANTVANNTVPVHAPAPVASAPYTPPPTPSAGPRPSRSPGWTGGGGFGGGPVGPVVFAVAGVLAALELRRRRRP